MGNCNDSNRQLIENLSEWEQVHRENYSVILKHPNKNQLIQKWTSLEIENPNIYAWRMKNVQKGLPKIRQLDEEVLPVYCHSKRNETLKGSIVITDVYTPLDKITSLTSGECALLVKNVLPGLRSLCEKFGWFKITSQNILVGQDGQAIIWIHPNLAVNKPRQKVNNKQSSQQKVVQVLINIVKQKMEQTQVLELPRQGVNFKKADVMLKDFLDKYCPTLNRIQINRTKYNHCEQRQKYRIITYHAQQMTQSDGLSKQRVITRTDSTNPSQRLGFKPRQMHPSYTSTRHISQASQSVFEKSKDEKGKDAVQERNAKDPDQLLFKLIQEYKLDQ